MVLNRILFFLSKTGESEYHIIITPFSPKPQVTSGAQRFEAE